MKNNGLLILLILGIILFSSSFSPPSGKKAAYKLHYQGSVQYRQGKVQKAVNFFQRAYDMEPSNFTFGFSLAVGLARGGNSKKGVKILKKSKSALRTGDPAYQKKMTLALFFEAVIYCYNEQFDKAISLLRKCIELQEALNEPRVLSIMRNTLGYAMMLDQGKGGHQRADLNRHYHVHKRDMERSLNQFEQALIDDPSNPAAWNNYSLLCDSLQLKPKVEPDTLSGREIKAYGQGGYSYLPANVLRTLEFTQYDEVLLLVDISGSMVMDKVTCMDTTRFIVMKHTSLYLLSQLDPKTEMGIATIGGDCGTEPKLWEDVGKLSRKDLRYAIDFLHPDGTTPLLERLKASDSLFSDQTQTRKSIFLISDGANICGDSGEDICEWADRVGREKITVNIMTFLDADLNNINAFAEYTCLADKTGGKILYLDNLRCGLEYYTYNLEEECMFFIPHMERVNCWGPAVKNLWAIFPER